MRSFEVRVMEHVPLCGDVVSVRLSRPPEYAFEPGQYLSLTVMTDEGPVRKPFTHSSSADAPYLEVTTHMSGSPYKRALADASPGTLVTVAGPAGRLVLPEEAEKVAFLVGGVGITPVASMVRTWRERGEGPEAAVFYGNRAAECRPFSEELSPGSDEPLVLIEVVEVALGNWAGEVGFITPELVRRHIDPADDWLFVVAGPPAMIPAMERCLGGLGLSAEEALVERLG